MIAALAGGSLPFILRTVMQPEKPEIEIGTVSFKNQMDEIIKNFVQYWPIYDLPFDVYTAEEEKKDKLKKEEEEQLAATENKDRGGLDCAQPVVQSVVKPPPAASVFQFETGVDTTCGHRGVSSNHVADNAAAAPEPSEAAQSATPCQHVCFNVENNDEEAEVDIVIYLPTKQDDKWLDEWSDLDNNDDVASSSVVESLDNAEVFAMQQL